MELTLLGTGCPKVDYKRFGPANLISSKKAKILEIKTSGIKSQKQSQNVVKNKTERSLCRKYSFRSSKVRVLMAISIPAVGSSRRAKVGCEIREHTKATLLF